MLVFLRISTLLCGIALMAVGGVNGEGAEIILGSGILGMQFFDQLSRPNLSRPNYEHIAQMERELDINQSISPPCPQKGHLVRATVLDDLARTKGRFLGSYSVPSHQLGPPSVSYALGHLPQLSAQERREVFEQMLAKKEPSRA